MTTLQVQSLKSFNDSGTIRFGPITLLVGRNNAGKSTLLRAIYAMQEGGGPPPDYVRRGHSTGKITLGLSHVNSIPGWPSADQATLTMQTPTSGQMVLASASGNASVAPVTSMAPNNFIFPFLSRRKSAPYSEAINQQAAMQVLTDLSTLPAKVDMLRDDTHPQHALFMELVEEVIGLRLSSITSPNGKLVGMWVSANERIFLQEMGEGVGQLLGFITNLCLARGKLFLVEELENDVHPEALRKLLRVIGARRLENQFVFSTHNNMVLRELGSLEDTQIYEVTMQTETEDGLTLPTSSIRRVGNSPAERTSLLDHLGYELSDLDLWDGWILLEESSAEKIIRDHLVRWFTPELSRVKTMSTDGLGNVKRTFNALYTMVLYTHLEERYRGRVAVIVDGDNEGLRTAAELRSSFPKWPAAAFANFAEPSFEHYYPARFAEKVEAALAVTDKQDRRQAKKTLLGDVLEWIEADDELAKAEFETSANEVIERLRAFEKALGPARPLL